MTHRELLELAAKAAGIDKKRIGVHPMHGNTWNPLINDGDALRLAVQCGINFYVMDGDLRIRYLINHITQIEVAETPGKCKPPVDMIHAVRRAIVRAAAEIGRAMP